MVVHAPIGVKGLEAPKLYQQVGSIVQEWI